MRGTSHWTTPPWLLALLFCTVSLSSAFNVDVKKPLIHRSSSDSSFGYSIDFYHSGNVNLLLVGAPFAQSNQRGISKSGVVYACDVRNQRCSQVHFDQTGNEQRLNGSTRLPIEDKSHQMFGATVVASKKGNVALACAPHYKYFFSKFEVVEPVGTCYYATDNFQKITEFAPCRQEPARHGHHRFGYGMCGFSAAVPDDGDDRLFISGPGTWYWQGAVFSQNIHNVTDRPNTHDGPARTDHHMMGYSTTSGDFDGDGKDDVVAGVPRANELVGMVYIYTSALRSIVNLTDENGQRGQYFGGSVAVTDLNKDGLDDLIVGSPFYTDYKSVVDAKTQERKPLYDLGKVTVYIQTGAGTFAEPVHLIGHSQWGRFGYSVAAAGDLNGDGFNDFIVGAPYDGEEGRGAVYIYHGSEDGVRIEPTQRIGASDLHKDLKTFGFSVSGERDIDDNGYPDIAVGAAASSQAVILRTKPVMQVTGSAKTNRKTINLDDKLCSTEFGRMPCEKLKFCVKYNGKLRPEHNNIDLKMKIRLDSKKTSDPRAFFSPKELARKRAKIHEDAVSRTQPDVIEQTVTMTKNREHCETHDIFVPDTIRDKISPIIVSVDYQYIEKRHSSDLLEPAVDTTLPQEFTTELVIEKDCGEDNICVPDLQMSATPTREKFTLGTSDQTLITNVTIRNSGEASYLTQLHITIPPGFEYGGIEQYGQSKQSISCSPADAKAAQHTNEPYDFVCDVGNPLPANERVEFGVRLTGTNVDTSKENIEVKMKVNSTNEEEPGHDSDNQFTLNVPLEIRAQLSLIGRSNPEQVDYSIRNRTPDDATFDFEIGPVVSHLYQVINRGPSAVKRATLDIFWPSYSDEGKHLLYIIDLPFVSDPNKAVCKIKQGQNVNPASLTISNRHMPTASTEVFSGEEGEEDEEEFENDDEEEFFDDERANVNDDDEYRRLKRAAKKQSTRRSARQSGGQSKRLRQMKDAMKQAVRLVKDTGHAVEYRGTLNPAAVNCNALNCTQISCDIVDLNEDEFVLVEIFSRVWVNTLIDDNVFEADISSLGFVQVTELPHTTAYRPLPQVAAVTTDVNPTDPEPEQSLPWWLILLAILIALLILAFIVACCWKCGFFKRDRPHYEKAQLNKSADKGEYYADSQARYAQPQAFSPGRHGTHV